MPGSNFIFTLMICLMWGIFCSFLPIHTISGILLTAIGAILIYLYLFNNPVL